MIKMLNTVTRMSRIGTGIQKRIRSKEPGLFRDTIIRDGDSAYGYDRDGSPYQIDADDIIGVGRFLWHHDEDGYLITDNMVSSDGRAMRMEELVMGAWDV